MPETHPSPPPGTESRTPDGHSAVLEAVRIAAERFLRDTDWTKHLPEFLERLGTGVDASRSYLFQIHREGPRITASQRGEWAASTVTPQIDNPDLQTLALDAAPFRRWLDTLERGEIIQGPIEAFPEDERPLLENQQILSLLVVPIDLEGVAWGFLGFDDCVDTRTWTALEIEALRSSASILGAAIERHSAFEAARANERRYELLYRVAERQRHELALLEELRGIAHGFPGLLMEGTADDRTDATPLPRALPTVLKAVVEGIRRHFDYDLVGLYLVQNDALVLEHITGYAETIPVIPLERGIMARAVRTRRAVLVENVTDDPDFIGARHGIASEIAVPLTFRNRIAGVLNVETLAPRTLTLEDLAFLRTLGAQVSHVIERLDAEARLLAARSLSDAIIESLPGVFYMLGPDGTYVRWNRRFEVEAGLDSDAVRSMDPLHFIHPPDAPAVAEAIAAAADGEEIQLRARVRHADGSTPTYLMTGRPLDVDGATHIVGMGLDISEMIDAEENLRRSEANLRAIFENSRDAFMLIDRNDLVIAFNRVAAERVRGTFGNVLTRGTSIFELVAPQNRDLLQTTLQAARHGETTTIEREIPVASGAPYWAEITYSPVFDEHGAVINVVFCSRDITERKAYARQVEQMAYYDALTDLPNRRLLAERARQALSTAERHDWPVALLYLDLDRFKTINDSLGHDSGDALLRQVTRVLTGCIRDSDTVARLGGDEFAFLLQNSDVTEAVRVAERILDSLDRPFTLDNNDVHVGGSIGITLFPKDARSFDELVKQADIAMYTAKERGGGYALFDATNSRYSVERLTLETELRRAVQRDELEFHYQPILDLRDDTIRDHESLVRWQRNDETVPAADFVPLAEESDIITLIDLKAVERAAKRAADAGDRSDLRYSVNISARTLLTDALDARLLAILARNGVPPERIVLEVTESAAMRDTDAAVRTLRSLRDLGFTVAIDDFGSGFASLTYLRTLPASRMKIDRALVAGLGSRTQDEHLVRAAIGLGHGLGFEVVAEGVETPEQLAWLRAHHCDYAQGFLIGRPEA